MSCNRFEMEHMIWMEIWPSSSYINFTQILSDMRLVTIHSAYLNHDKIILRVLLKGMMRLPQPDFVMYKSLLSSLTDPDMDKNVTRALGKLLIII